MNRHRIAAAVALILAASCGPVLAAENLFTLSGLVTGATTPGAPNPPATTSCGLDSATLFILPGPHQPGSVPILCEGENACTCIALTEKDGTRALVVGTLRGEDRVARTIASLD